MYFLSFLWPPPQAARGCQNNLNPTSAKVGLMLMKTNGAYTNSSGIGPELTQICYVKHAILVTT